MYRNKEISTLLHADDVYFIGANTAVERENSKTMYVIFGIKKHLIFSILPFFALQLTVEQVI